MFPILSKQLLSQSLKRLDIFAPQLAARIQPGQYVLVGREEKSARIALTVIDWDIKKGSIAVLFDEKDPDCARLVDLQIKDELAVVIGPLGDSLKFEKIGTVVCVATGLGSAKLLPVVRALKKEGNKTISIMGGKNRKSILLEEQMRLAATKHWVATDDGLYIKRGYATDVLKDVLKTENVNMVFLSGSANMLHAAAEITRERNIKTWAMLQPLIFDGTGQCGSCRVSVGGKTVLACQEGPFFDAHQIDYEELQHRYQAFEESVFKQGQENNSWDNSLTANRATKEPGIFRKFIWGARAKKS